jgi:hypothetical protein
MQFAAATRDNQEDTSSPLRGRGAIGNWRGATEVLPIKLNRRRDAAVDQKSKRDLECQVHHRGIQVRYVLPRFELRRWRQIPKGDRFVPIHPRKGKDSLPQLSIDQIGGFPQWKDSTETTQQLLERRVVLPRRQLHSFKTIGQLLIGHQSLLGIVSSNTYDWDAQIVSKKPDSVE